MRVLSTWRLSAVVAVAVMACVAATASAQTADEVMAKNIKAQGGKDALLGVKGLERKGDIKVDGTFGQMEGSVKEVSIPWKKAYRSLDLAVFIQDEGFDGTVAWRNGQMGLQDLEGQEAAQIKQATDLNPFVKLADRGLKAEKLDDEKVEDVDYYVIQLTGENRPPVKVYIDKKDDLIARTTLTQENPQFGKVDVVLESSDYEAFGPVKLPTKNKIQLGELMEIQTTYTETKIDGTVDEKVFDKPKEEAK